MNPETQPTPQETHALLQRLLKAVEPAKPRRAIEVACAIILSLATTASAWCAYQSKLWGGAQMSRSNAAAKISREEAVHSIAELQTRAFDASMFIVYMQARLEQRQATEQFLQRRFRPELRPVVEAWLQLDPLTNPAAPSSPFQMPEYLEQAAADEAQWTERASAALARVRQARQYSDHYVLLTVLFASVLFFGGIARAFDARLVRVVLTALAITLFVGTLVGLLSLPMCPE